MNNIPFKNKDIEFLGKKKRIREMRGDEYVNMPNTSEAYNEAKKRGEVVKFATAKRAEKMAFGAWKKGDARKEAMQNYANYKKTQRSR